MVPLHLRLYNFLSYQSATELDLRGIHVGCLSGDNGNGKSALLDAVTWALWGWARGRRYGTGGASPDELVYQGQTDMEVALTFAAGEATYRMVRKHSKGGGRRGAARMVDLQAATGDGFRSLTEGSVAETEAQVQRLLRMSYDTFVNSAFMLQGEADRFTTSKPAQRKETLADILGLSLYERLQDRAKEHVRDFDAQLLRNQVDRETTERELANRPGVEQSLDDARRMLEGLAPLLRVARAEEAALEARVASLERVQEEADRLQEAVGQRAVEADRLEAQAEQARDRAARYSNVLERRGEILDGAGRLVAGQQRLAALGEAQQQDASLERRAMELEYAIAQEADRLASEADRLRDRAERELRPRVERGRAAQTALEDSAKGEDGIVRQREGVLTQRAELDAAARAVERMEADNQRLDAELAELRGGYRMLREGETHCPLCGTALGADGLAHIRQERERQGLERRAQFDENGRQVAALVPKRAQMEGALAEAEGALEQAQRSLAAKKAALEREMEEGVAASAELASVAPGLDALVGRMADEDFALAERESLAESRGSGSSWRTTLRCTLRCEKRRARWRPTRNWLATCGMLRSGCRRSRRRQGNLRRWQLRGGRKRRTRSVGWRTSQGSWRTPPPFARSWTRRAASGERWRPALRSFRVRSDCIRCNSSRWRPERRTGPRCSSRRSNCRPRRLPTAYSWTPLAGAAFRRC